MYFGEIGKRYNEMTLKLVKQYEYTSTFGYGYNNVCYINVFEDVDGNTFVWKTSAIMGVDSVDDHGRCFTDFVRKNDTVVVKATVKDHKEYRGTEQTVLSRVSAVRFVDRAPTKEEILAEKKKDQLASISGKDILWRMPYRQYKEHYADCETLAGSYDGNNATVEVIIREGRLVPSGVRGKHFHTFVFVVDGNGYSFYAISKENAENRCRKEFPNAKSILFDEVFY